MTRLRDVITNLNERRMVTAGGRDEAHSPGLFTILCGVGIYLRMVRVIDHRPWPNSRKLSFWIAMGCPLIRCIYM